MKLSVLVVPLLLAGSASGYSISRSSLRSLGQTKSVSFAGSSRSKTVASLKMEDFGLFKGTKIGFDDLWSGEEVISEVGLEKKQNDDGMRYKMTRTASEADEVGRMTLAGIELPAFNVNLPLIGETYLGPPKAADLWEAMGFTATMKSNNNAANRKRVQQLLALAEELSPRERQQLIQGLQNMEE